MNNILGIFLSIVFLTLAAIFLLVLGAWVRHKLLGRKEKKYLSPKGQFVQVNDHLIHIVCHGTKRPQIVFLSSAGMCSPALDYLPLTRALSSTVSTVVVEHAGSGYSDDTKLSRNINMLLEEDRDALNALGVLPPYIFCVHSMAGIEALRWAQKYPDEVSAIIGIDIAVPQVYYHAQINKVGVFLGRLASELGLERMTPQILEAQPQLTENCLSDKEKAEFRALYYKHGSSIAAKNEALEIWNSAVQVQEGASPDVPILLLVSDGRWIALQDGKQWRDIQREFAENLPECHIIEFDCGHYIHQHFPQQTAAAIIDWLRQQQLIDPAWE